MSLRGLVMGYGNVLTEGPADLARRARASGRPTALVPDAQAVPDECAVLFDVLVLGPTLGARRPDPEVFRRTARLFGAWNRRSVWLSTTWSPTCGCPSGGRGRRPTC